MNRKQNSSKRSVSKMAKAGAMAAMMTAAMWCSPMSVSAGPFNCAADLNGNGTVGPPDLSIFLGDWGPCPPDPDPLCPRADCPSDLDCDGQVHGSDLAVLLHAWGQNLCLGNAGVPMPLGFYECFDLDEGMMMDPGMPFCISQQVDMHLAYNADTENHLRVLPDNALGMALTQQGYGSVNCETLVLLDANGITDGDGVPDIEEPLDPSNVDMPLGNNDTLIIKTSGTLGVNYYKVRATQIGPPDGIPEVTISFGQLCPPNSASE